MGIQGDVFYRKNFMCGLLKTAHPSLILPSWGDWFIG